jgi:hypothetical protein
MPYTTTDLISSIKLRGLIPTSQSTYQQADFLRLATEEMQGHIAKLMQSAREEYFVTEKDFEIVAGKSSYPIPSRAIGGALRDVLLVNGEQIVSLDRIEADNVEFSQSIGFTLKNNSVVVRPTPTSSQGKLRLVFCARPSKLVPVSECAMIESVDLDNNQVTVVSLPSNITASSSCDLVKANSGFECQAIDLTPVGISGLTIEFESLPEDLEVGDFVTLAGHSPVPQIPVELHTLLAQRVVVRVLEGLGDKSGLESARAELKELNETCLSLITPRVRGESKRVLNTRKLSRYV